MKQFNRVGRQPLALYLLVLFLFSFGPELVVARQSQTAETAKRKAPGLRIDPAKLAKINVVMESAEKKGKVVGCSALVSKGDDEVFFNTWGMRDREHQLPMKRDTIFRIYSMSKPITSVAVMQLVEKGLIDLDDPVAKYLKEFSDLKVAKPSGQDDFVEIEPKRVMTVRDLLRHTSGLTYGFFAKTPVDLLYLKSGILILDRNIAQTVQKLGKIPLKNHPGSQFEYSVSTDVLGRLIEVVSGEGFDQYLSTHIFEPLEMHDTCFTVPQEKLDRLAVMYRDDAKGELQPSPALASYRFVNQANKFYSGGGGLCSTVDDYLNFSRMLISYGQFKGKTILKRETLEQMFTNQLRKIDNRPRNGFQFGLGFRIERGKLGTEYSWGGIAGTRFWVNPEQKLISIFMVQVNPYGQRRLGKSVRKIAYDALVR